MNKCVPEQPICTHGTPVETLQERTGYHGKERCKTCDHGAYHLLDDNDEKIFECARYVCQCKDGIGGFGEHCKDHTDYDHKYTRHPVYNEEIPDSCTRCNGHKILVEAKTAGHEESTICGNPWPVLAGKPVLGSSFIWTLAKGTGWYTRDASEVKQIIVLPNTCALVGDYGVGYMQQGVAICNCGSSLLPQQFTFQHGTNYPPKHPSQRQVEAVQQVTCGFEWAGGKLTFNGAYRWYYNYMTPVEFTRKQERQLDSIFR